MTLPEVEPTDELQDSDVEAMRERLRQAYAQHPENNLFRQVKRKFRDPAKPEDVRGRWRPHPLLLLLGALTLAAIAIFLYWSFFQ